MITFVIFLICTNILGIVHPLKHNKLPNFVFVLTDDQDVTLGGMLPMINTRHLLQNEGAEFQNMFASSPLCCPSRASILTGCYAHNHGVVNNSLSGHCSSLLWQQTTEKKTFITYLKEAGYSTFYGGKYLNQYGDPKVGGVKHIPPGWNWWIALVGNSQYYNYTLSVNGKEEKHDSNPFKDYLTDVIVRRALRFLYNQKSSKDPFFLMLAPPAPHSPFTPAPWHKRRFPCVKAPRTPNFNIPGGEGKHWLLRQAPSPLPKYLIHDIDTVFRNRWRTLLSVDDAVRKIFYAVQENKMLENTFFIFSSDNGFHMGQFSLPWDKRQLYEFDIRVPLVIRGPGIVPGIKIEKPVMNIDLAPTILELAGIKPPHKMDGMSLIPLLNLSRKSVVWRENFIIEHQGEFSNGPIPRCPQYKPEEVHTCEIDCICEDSKNNTYLCLRTISSVDNSIHCLFQDHEAFIEVYNLTADPFQLQNLYPFIRKSNLEQKINKLKQLKDCRGSECRGTEVNKNI